MKPIRLLLAALLAFSPALSLAANHRRKAKPKPKPKPVAKAPDLSPELTRAGLQSLDKKDYAAAIANFSKAVQSRGNCAGYFLLGYSYYQRGFAAGTPDAADKQDAQELVNAYTTALALDPKLSALEQPYLLHHGLAMAYETLGQNDKAIEAYKNAFALAPSNPLLPLYAARLRLKMGDAPKARNNLELALKRAKSTGQEAGLIALIKSNPMFAPLLADAGEAKLIAQYGQAPSAGPVKADSLAAMTPKPAGDALGLRDAVRGTTPKQTPRPAPIAGEQAVLDQIAAGNDEFRYRRFPAAVSAYNDALILNQQTQSLSPAEIAYVQERIGTSYNRLGQTTEAIIALRRSLQSLPVNAAARYQLSIAYSLSGHYLEAMKSLREAFKSAPSPSELRKLILLARTDTELEPIRDLPSFEASLKEFSAPARDE